MMMNKMEYAFHAYATFIEGANSFHLQALGLDEKDRQQILKQEYILKCDKTIQEYTAEYGFKVRKLGKKRDFTSLYKYAPTVETLSFPAMISIAAHEINHSLRQNRNEKTHKEQSAFAGKAIGYSTAFVAAYCADSLHWSNLLQSAAIGAVAGFGTYYAVKNSLSYLDEKQAYIHDGAIEEIFSNKKTPRHEIEDNLQILRAQNPVTKQIKEAVFSGYPSASMRELLIFQGKEIVSKNDMNYNIHDILYRTGQNIKRGKFNITSMKPPA